VVWHDGLEVSEKPYAIASSDADNIIVLAGPGTGKSFSMKRRVARLLEEGVKPEQILAVTFTNVAVDDMHQELVGMSVAGADKLQAQTLHSLALSILSRHHVLSSTGRNPRPLLEYEKTPLVSDMKAHGGKRKIDKMINACGTLWQSLVPAQLDGFCKQELDAFHPDLTSWLVFHNSILLEEIIPEARGYLKRNPTAFERSEFEHVLVDEYQDFNKSEQEFIKFLSDNAKVCIIGDDDQSIYSFKHAHPTGLQEWMDNNSGHVRFGIDNCYRCPVKIVSLANALISKNITRLPKTLQPRLEKGDGIVDIGQYHSLEKEVEGIVSFVKECVDKGINAGDILVLAQRKEISTPIYERLLEKGVPVKSYFRETALKTDLAKERFSLFTLLIDRNDRVSLRWLLGSTSSGNWYAGGYKKLRAYCEICKKSPFQALDEQRQGIKTISGTDKLKTRFEEIFTYLEKLDAISSVEEQLNQLFPEDEAGLKLIRDDALRLLEADNSCSLQKLYKALLAILSRPEVDDEGQKVRIMSLHKSKGLSSPITIIAGCLEGFLPKRPESSLSDNEQTKLIEEQRRLFYVGMTRVKANPDEGKKGVLIITSSISMPYATAKRCGLEVGSLQASTFLSELGNDAPAQQVGISVKASDLF